MRETERQGLVKERENNRKRDRYGKEKCRKRDCLREREREIERDRVWCKREKIIERETGMGRRNRERETV